MEVITAVVSAIALGAADLKAAANISAVNAYEAVKSHLGNHYPSVDLAQFERDPHSPPRRALLAEELGQAKVIDDAALLGKISTLLQSAAEIPDAAVVLTDIQAARVVIDNITSSGQAVVANSLAVSADVTIRGVNNSDRMSTDCPPDQLTQRGTDPRGLRPPDVSLTNSSIGGNVVTARNYYDFSGVSITQFVKILGEREAEIRRELGSEISAQTEKRIALEAELHSLRSQLANAADSLETFKLRLADTAAQLDSLRNDFDEADIDNALKALHEGRQELAAALLADAEKKAMAHSHRMLSHAARAAFQRGVISESKVQFRDAFEHYSRSTVLDPEIASYANSAGYLAFKLGRFVDAENYYQKAIGLIREGKGPSKLTPDVLSNLAGVYLDQGKLSDAIATLEQVKSIQEKEAAAAEIAKTLNNLGGAYHAAARYDIALEYYKEALRIRESAFERGSLAVASTLNNMGDLFYSLHDLNSAERYHREALTIRERLLSSSHPDLVPSLNNLATVHLSRGDVDSAGELFNRALQIQRAIYGPDHHTVAITLNNLALVERSRGNTLGAEQYFRKALEISQASLGADHAWTSLIRKNLSDLGSGSNYRVTGRQQRRWFRSRLLH
jgi:tetratricopeptide (TPR) repeat protein